MPKYFLKTDGPVYRGVTAYRNEAAGYRLWIPSEWVSTKLNPGYQGMLFSPYADDYNTSVLVEKRRLKYKVTEKDMPMLVESFHEGINALPGVEIEWNEETLTSSLSIFDARFAFDEGDARRKRWVRNIYWGEAQLILIAQGRTPEDFEYWLPMFYNIMMTAEIL